VEAQVAADAAIARKDRLGGTTLLDVQQAADRFSSVYSYVRLRVF